MLLVEQGAVARLGDLAIAQCPLCSQPRLPLALNPLPHDDRDPVKDGQVSDLDPGVRGRQSADKEPVGAVAHSAVPTAPWTPKFSAA